MSKQPTPDEIIAQFDSVEALLKVHYAQVRWDIARGGKAYSRSPMGDECLPPDDSALSPAVFVDDELAAGRHVLTGEDGLSSLFEHTIGSLREAIKPIKNLLRWGACLPTFRGIGRFDTWKAIKREGVVAAPSSYRFLKCGPGGVEAYVHELDETRRRNESSRRSLDMEAATSLDDRLQELGVAREEAAERPSPPPEPDEEPLQRARTPTQRWERAVLKTAKKMLEEAGLDKNHVSKGTPAKIVRKLGERRHTLKELAGAVSQNKQPTVREHVSPADCPLRQAGVVNNDHKREGYYLTYVEYGQEGEPIAIKPKYGAGI